MDRWAVVPDGSTSLSLRGEIDAGGLDTLASEERREGVGWGQR